MPETHEPKLTVQQIWNRNAAFWDEYMGEGGEFQQHLIGPATERLLHLKAGEHILDVACGNGAFTRRMAQLGASVVAIDFSTEFIARAIARTTERVDQIVYKVIDVTDGEQLLSLGENAFDAAVCTMAMMDMSNIETLLLALRRMLRPNGRYVFSVTHPCFNSGPGMTKSIEEQDRDGKMIVTYAVEQTHYARPSSYRGLGIIGQPVPQEYFHRPLHDLFGVCFRAGFVMDALEEPTFDASTQPDRPFAWSNFLEIPPVLVARMVLAAGTTNVSEH
jgi:2-polyprenyl-3-methyl-5-hydroxy-6-metoxy-1,4-benzoquinol methylase